MAPFRYLSLHFLVHRCHCHLIVSITAIVAGCRLINTRISLSPSLLLIIPAVTFAVAVIIAASHEGDLRTGHFVRLGECHGT
jgi:hypothetical protein